MPKFTRQTLSSGFASTDDLEQNFIDLETFSDNTISRNGQAPNAMNANLDMNSNDIINVRDIYAAGVNIDGVNVIQQMLNIFNNYTQITTNVTISTLAPTNPEGDDGDIWFQIP